MSLKPKLRCFPCLGLDSLASYKTKPWGLDPINSFSCDYQRTARITHKNVENTLSELDKRHPFPRILCPVLVSKLFLCFTKICLPMQLILFLVQATLSKAPGSLPAKLFRFSSGCKIPLGQTAPQPPLPFARELRTCALREMNLLSSSISPGTVPRHCNKGSHTHSS